MPWLVVHAFAHAFASSSCLTTCSWPSQTAMCSAVAPLIVCAPVSAPSRRSSLTTAR